MTEEEVKHLQEKNRVAVMKNREKMSDEKKEKANKEAKNRMKNQREKYKISHETPKELSQEKKEYIRISDKYRKKEWRNKRSEEEYVNEKLNAKKGMQEFREYGRLRDFSKRSVKIKDEISDWANFVQKGDPYLEVLSSKKPDLIDRINQKIREEKEEEREKEMKEKETKEKEEAKRKEGIWDYNGESGEWYWTGEKEPDHMDNFTYKPLTEEEKKQVEEAEELHFQWWAKERAEERKEKRRKKYKELKEKMAIPVDPVPKSDLCPYEKLRERNIKEREEAMRKCGFFDDLENTKREIGIMSDE